MNETARVQAILDATPKGMDGHYPSDAIRELLEQNARLEAVVADLYDFISNISPAWLPENIRLLRHEKLRAAKLAAQQAGMP